MPRVTHLRPTKADLGRIAKAAAEAGVVMREEFISADGSKIVVMAGVSSEALNGSSANPWDEVLDDATNKKRAS